MSKTVNVQGVAKQPVFIGDELYSRGQAVDINLDRDIWVNLGVAFLQDMIIGYKVDFVEQKPIEEADKELDNVEIQELVETAEAKTVKSFDKTSAVIPKKQGRPASKK